MLLLAINVDDIVVFPNGEKSTQRIKNELSSRLKMKTSSVLGMRVQRDMVNN
ncbi:unnamed protein product, partial [Ceratitis capitata]